MATTATALPAGRKWVLRLMAICIPPLVVFGGLELVLRVAGFGFDPHYFKSVRVAGQVCYVANDDFGLRFFPRGLARIPRPAMVPADKASGTFRIFIFGESAALGDPRPNYGAGRYLNALLAERYPDARFEVVNTGITAINSHAILPIAEECARREGDLWLIYMGNNEMVGPFGAATVFGARAPPLWLVRAELQLQRLRVGQLLFGLTQKLRRADATGHGWQGMEMFVHNQLAPHDPRKETVYRNFARNLRDILNAGLASGAKVVLSTIAVNLKDCPPFGSMSDESLASADRASYRELCREGIAAEAQGRYAEAQLAFERATKLHPLAAEAQYRLASCCLHGTNRPLAQASFQAATDLDTLPFRADSRINDVIRAAARQRAGRSLVLCDAAAALDAASPAGIAGDELFYEHVHLNPRGNYALALAWAKQVEQFLPEGLKRDARPAWPSSTECDQLLGLTDWNRVSTLEEVLARVEHPPFSGQLDNAQKVAQLRREVAAVRERLSRTDAAAQARAVYERALRRAPDDFRLHENYAEFLEAQRDWKLAIPERKRVCELLPWYYFSYYSLGLTLKDAGALAEAREALLKAAELRPTQGQVRLELGIVWARQGEWDLARECLEEAHRLSPDDPRAPLYLGEVLWKLGRRDAALEILREAIRLNPTDWQPHYRLASDLAQQGNLSAAAEEYREALRLNPGNVKTELGLTTVLLSLGHPLEAQQLLDEVLKREPNNPAALEMRRSLGGG